MSSELSCLVRELKPRFEDQFKLIQTSFDASRFGDSIATYSDGAIQIRFIRDRGELLCEFKLVGVGVNWVSLNQMLPEAPRSLRPEQESHAICFAIEEISQRHENLSLLLGAVEN